MEYKIRKRYNHLNMNHTIKCWITRQTAFSIQCGGLERLFIHFSKPVYYYTKMTEKDRDNAFGDITEKEGLFKKIGWHEPNAKMWTPPQSVGNLLGYDNEISNFIWDELKKHFNNEPFERWHNVEKEGKCKLEDFCLELNISLSLNNNSNG